jgi:hypothetical protein
MLPAHSTQDATAAAIAAGHTPNTVALQVADSTGFRGALASGNPAFRKYGSYDQVLTGRSLRRLQVRLIAKMIKKSGHRE